MPRCGPITRAGTLASKWGGSSRTFEWALAPRVIRRSEFRFDARDPAADGGSHPRTDHPTRMQEYHDESGDYGIMVLWSSKTHADAAAGVVSPVLNAALAEAGATSERRRLFEVLQLRSEPSLTG